MKALIFISVWWLLSSVAEASPHCRSSWEKHRFDVAQGYPHGRPGYIVDHVCALSCNGKDDHKTNMQYQLPAESRAKDRWENTAAGCKKTCTPLNSTPTRQVFNCRKKKSL